MLPSGIVVCLCKLLQSPGAMHLKRSFEPPELFISCNCRTTCIWTTRTWPSMQSALSCHAVCVLPSSRLSPCSFIYAPSMRSLDNQNSKCKPVTGGLVQEICNIVYQPIASTLPLASPVIRIQPPTFITRRPCICSLSSGITIQRPRISSARQFHRAYDLSISLP